MRHNDKELGTFSFISCSTYEFSFLAQSCNSIPNAIYSLPKVQVTSWAFLPLEKDSAWIESDLLFEYMLYCVLLGYSFEFRLNCNSRVRGAAASVMTISVYQTRLKRENKIDKSRSSMGLRRLQKLYAIQADKTIRILLHRKKRHKKAILLM